MRKERTEILATAMVFSLGLTIAVAVGASITDGFQAFTLESARRLEALRAPREVKHLRLETLDHGQVSLRAYADQWVLVDFIYTRCATLCSSLGSIYAQLQQRLSSEIAEGKVQLLSVSFDPEHDGPSQLAAYRARHVKSSSGWTGWTLGRPSPNDTAAWLERFGVVVVPDGLGGYAHNAAIHVIGPDGRLRAILDLDDIETSVRLVQHAKHF
jgi:protein SCO1